MRKQTYPLQLADELEMWTQVKPAAELHVLGDVKQ